MRRDDKDEVKEGLKARIEEVCARLLPTGRLQGRLWVSNNPITGDAKQSPELKVAVTRDLGAWKCWRSGAKGDVFGLIEYVNGTDFKGAMRWARDFLGLQDMTPAERQKFARDAEAAKERDKKQSQQRDRKNRKKGEALFMAGLVDGAGSAAEALARRYFEVRGCGLDLVRGRDRQTMRYSAATEWWRGADWKKQANGYLKKLRDGPEFPAVHCALRGPTGLVTGCHVTFLHPTLAQKADVTPPKLMRGEAKGSVIRISHGPEGEPPEVAQKAMPLILCEGVEDGLSLAGAVPEARVWSAASLSNMANAPIWMDCVSDVLLAADNDWSSKQAMNQFDGVVEALEKHGKPLAIMRAHEGKDFNDLLQPNQENGD